MALNQKDCFFKIEGGLNRGIIQNLIKSPSFVYERVFYENRICGSHILEALLDKLIVRARQTVPLKARRCLLVKITTDEGYVGYGEGLTLVAPQAALRNAKRLPPWPRRSMFIMPLMPGVV